MKVISLVPSITEALFDLGLTSSDVIGRTKFCIHPSDKVKDVERVGGTKNLNIKRIKELQPDLIIANKEENTKEQIEELQKYFKVWVTEIATIEDNYYLNKQLGSIFHSEELAQRYNLAIYDLLLKYRLQRPLKVAYLIWKNPYMSIGGDTFISRILEELGCINILKRKSRYPEISINELREADVVFLSSEPYPFKEKDIIEIKEHLQEVPVLLVDGEVFSWYGTHIAKSEPYLKELTATLKSLF